jgi:hypothetical protein
VTNELAGATWLQDGGMWDDSLLSRDEADARTKRKAEAVMKRERALAYAYSHQVRTFVASSTVTLKTHNASFRK